MLKNNNLSHTAQNHSSVTKLYIPNCDKEHHNNNIEMSLAVRKIIQA